MLLSTRCITSRNISRPFLTQHSSQNGPIRRGTGRGSLVNLEQRTRPRWINDGARAQQSLADAEFEEQMRQEWANYHSRRSRRRWRNRLFLALGFANVTSVYIWARTRERRTVDTSRYGDDDLRPLGSLPVGPLPAWKRSTFVDETLNGRDLILREDLLWAKGNRTEWITMVWLGKALCGWPGVVHGGVVATAVSDAMSQAAADLLPSDGSLPSPASFKIDYLRPTKAAQRVSITVARHHYTAEPEMVGIPPPGQRLIDPRSPPLDPERKVPRLFLVAVVHDLGVRGHPITASAIGSFDIPEEHQGKAIEVDVMDSKERDLGYELWNQLLRK